MLSDPLSITYDGVARTLARVSVTSERTVYKSADGQFEISISKMPSRSADTTRVIIAFTRVTPDSTPADRFDPYRDIVNSVELGFEVDVTRHEATTVIPLLRSALLAFVDTTLQGRLIAGEK